MVAPSSSQAARAPEFQAEKTPVSCTLRAQTLHGLYCRGHVFRLRACGNLLPQSSCLEINSANDGDWFIDRKNVIDCAAYSRMIASADLAISSVAIGTRVS